MSDEGYKGAEVVVVVVGTGCCHCRRRRHLSLFPTPYLFDCMGEGRV